MKAWDLRIAKRMAEVGAKFRQKPARPLLPVWNESSRAGFEEDEAE